MRAILLTGLLLYVATGRSQAFEETVIWPLNDTIHGVYEHFVFGLASTKRGTVLAFAEGRLSRGDDSPHHIILKRSTDNGKHWESSRVLVRSTKGICYANPTPLVDRQTGTVFLFYAQNFNNDSSRVYCITSRDEGATWSGPRDLTALFAGDPFKRPFHLPGPGHGITLRNGRLLLQVWHRYSIRVPEQERKYGSSVIYSDDHGLTWKPGGYIPGAGRVTAGEARMVELPDGKIFFSARGRFLSVDSTKQGPVITRVESLSSDQGRSWSYPRESTIEPFTSVDAGVGQLSKDGVQYLLLSRPLGPKRENLGISYSKDQGKTWSRPVLLYKGPANYSDITVLPDQTILVLYGRGRPRYGAMVRLRLADILVHNKQ
ncbi:sialidase family protein [Niabella aurantiaca]|uniref:sialidase family protein n=1 Tax=Niabella aurantiaca TaxID=379900 RepID=UPI0003825832|nr:sialidase family protein [Niabella aurantiaca]